MEERERRFFEWWTKTNPHIRNYKVTETPPGEQGIAYDASAVSGTSKIIFEIKCRLDKTNQWFLQPGYGPFGEQLKINRLQEAKERILQQHNTNVIVMFLCFTSNGWLLYRIKHPDTYTFEEWMLPKNKKKGSPLVPKPISKLRFPEEQYLFNEDSMTEEEWHYINSVE